MKKKNQNAAEAYPDAISALLNRIKEKNKTQVEKASLWLKNCFEKKGLLYVFGSGHSSLLVEEAFHRAGGLIPIYPVLFDFLSPHVSPKIAGKFERKEGVAEILFERLKPQKNDLVWISSNSGINAVPIEMALAFKKAKIKVICTTSLEHSMKIKSRHSSGKKLFECSDLVFDNACPEGDALVQVDEKTAVSPGSTIANSYLYYWTATRVCQRIVKSGKSAPVYRSANLPGSDAQNEKNEAWVRKRVALL
jgi:uncharacterized phosphosugar-binding protein